MSDPILSPERRAAIREQLSAMQQVGKLHPHDWRVLESHVSALLAAYDQITRERDKLREQKERAWFSAHDMEHWPPLMAAHADIAQLEQRAEQAEAALVVLTQLLRRIRQWDQLPETADGPYWIREIDSLLGSTGPEDAPR